MFNSDPDPDWSYDPELERLESLSNGVVDLIEGGLFEEAERHCGELKARFRWCCVKMLTVIDNCIHLHTCPKPTAIGSSILPNAVVLSRLVRSSAPVFTANSSLGSWRRRSSSESREATTGSRVDS